jgi:hypothetical protein
VQNPVNLFFFENCLSGVESKGNDVLANRWMKDKTVGMPQMHSLTIQGLATGVVAWCGRQLSSLATQIYKSCAFPTWIYGRRGYNKP